MALIYRLSTGPYIDEMHKSHPQNKLGSFCVPFRPAVQRSAVALCPAPLTHQSSTPLLPQLSPRILPQSLHHKAT